MSSPWLLTLASDPAQVPPDAVDRKVGKEASLLNYGGGYIWHVIRGKPAKTLAARLEKLAGIKAKFFAKMGEVKARIRT